MKKMIALAFSPVIWLKIFHKIGFPCEPDSGCGLLLGVFLKDPGEILLLPKAGNASSLLLAFQVSVGITLYVLLARWQQ